MIAMKFLAPLALAGLMAATPAAADLTDMDDAEREAFRPRSAPTFWTTPRC
jgi:hypothetical protein